jgi:tetratricopeptide (TPR) repeat protein
MKTKGGYGMQGQCEIPISQEYNAQGKVLLSAGNYEAALKYFDKAEAEDPMLRETYMNQGECHIYLGEYDKAKSAYEKALLLDKQDGEVYFHLGNIAFLQEQADEGRTQYANAVNAGYDDPQMYIHLGFMLLNENSPEKAVEQFNKALARDKFQAEAWLNKAKAYASMGRMPEALQALDGMIEYLPEIFEGHHYKALFLCEQRRYPEAQVVLDKALRLFPDDIDLHFDQLLLLEAQERLSQALKYYGEHFAESENPLHLHEKAKLLAANDRVEEALILYDLLFQCEDIDIAREARFSSMLLYMQQGEKDKAIAQCDTLIEPGHKDNNYYTCLYLKGAMLDKSGDSYHAKRAYEFAVAELRLASSGDPGVLDYYLIRALCLKELREFTKAFDIIEYLLSLNPQMAEALYIRSQLYKATYDDEKAEADLQAMRAIGGTVSHVFSMIQSAQDGGGSNGQ